MAGAHEMWECQLSSCLLAFKAKGKEYKIAIED